MSVELSLSNRTHLIIPISSCSSSAAGRIPTGEGPLGAIKEGAYADIRIVNGNEVVQIESCRERSFG